MAIPVVALTLTFSAVIARADDDWVPIPQENLLYVDISGGIVIIELHPEAAPGHVARIKELAKAGFYDGLTFHRVIDDFMAQGGDPLGTGEGGSSKPDLKAEFTFTHDPGAPSLGTDQNGNSISIDGAAVVLTEPEVMQYSRHNGSLQSWLPHCRGVASMARAENVDSANSQFFIMFSATHEPDLDRNYTPWGRVVYGMDKVDRIQHGEPPRNPTRIYHFRLGTDVAEKDRLALEELSSKSQAMHDMISDLETRSHGHFNACDIEVPVRVAPATYQETTP